MRLYEQKKHLPNWQMLLDDYRQYWLKWVYSDIPSSIINFDSQSVELRLFLNSTDAKPIIPNAKIANVEGSGALTGELVKLVML